MSPEELAAQEAAKAKAAAAAPAEAEAAAQAAAQAAALAEQEAAIAALKARQEAGETLTPEELEQLNPPAAESDELVVTLGDEEPPEGSTKDDPAPAWVRELRTQHKEQARRLRELEDENKALKAPKTETIKAKPTLEGCGYDEAKFETELTSWYEAKRKQDADAQAQRDAETAEHKAWQDKLDAYEVAKKELKLPGLDDAEDAAKSQLDITQQGIILHGAAKPALMFYVLGKNAKELERVAAIKDPVKFSFAIAQLEVQVKVTTKKAPPAEKMPPAGGKSGSSSLDNTLDKLREEAARTGNYTKLHQYKAAQREKAKS
ncbi:MAG: hypothetical protein WC736_15610 [Gallionella sp.]|jgi:hypothetical protein